MVLLVLPIVLAIGFCFLCYLAEISIKDLIIALAISLSYLAGAFVIAFLISRFIIRIYSWYYLFKEFLSK